MSMPASMRGGPFTPMVLVKKRYLLFYFFILWVSLFVALLEFWMYWHLFHGDLVLFWLVLPAWGFLIYISMVFSSLLMAKLLLIIVNAIYPPRTGVFLRHPSDRDYRYWSIRNTIKRFPAWISHKFPLPFLDNICFKMFGVKTTFSNSLFEGWVDTEFITFGKNVVVGQASHVQSAVIMGNFLIIRETVIEDDVRIGAHCVVMPGTHIGKNCMLGAESFTTVGQELEAGWIYLGVPAKKLKRNWFSDPDLEDELEHDLNMDVAEIRKLYEENFYVRHDEHHSILDRLTQDTNEPEE